jgi:hypothetical protein
VVLCVVSQLGYPSVNGEIKMRVAAFLMAIASVFAASCKRHAPPLAQSVDAAAVAMKATASVPSVVPVTAAPPAAIVAPDTAPEVPLSKPPSGDATPDAEPSDAPHFASSWTDPEAVALLLQSCSTGPPPFEFQGQTGAGGDLTSPLACALPFMQSCEGYHPCTAGRCRGRCEKTCVSCDKECIGGCTSCREQCKDDACKKACAAQTGQCKQGCITRLDHCLTGECAREEDVCEAKEALKWSSHHCSCRPITECLAPCVTNSDNGACRARCQRNAPDCDISYCYMMEPDQPGPQVFEPVDH